MPRGRLQAASECGHERHLQAVQEPVLQGAFVSWWVSHATLSAKWRSLTAPAAATGDHNCMRLSGGISRSASAPQLVPKVVPGVLVSSTAKPKEAQAAPGPQKVRTHCSADPALLFLTGFQYTGDRHGCRLFVVRNSAAAADLRTRLAPGGLACRLAGHGS